jgi:hypothetical protein
VFFAGTDDNDSDDSELDECVETENSPVIDKKKR